jgi:hypothetical protein
MKHSVSCLLFFVSCFIPEITLQAQWGRGFDSVALLKPKISRTVYNFTDGSRREISLTAAKSELIELERNAAGNNGGGLMTLVTGIGWNSSSAAVWKVSSRISCNDSLADWTVVLFCQGELERTRERVRDSDGSWSVEKDEVPHYFWDRKAAGIIIEGTDTIGYFDICTNPRSDSLMKEYAGLVLPPLKEGGSAARMTWFVVGRPGAGMDYGITGKLAGKPFWLIHNGLDRKVWISYDSLLSGRFQSDLDLPQVSKKYRINPCLVINSGIQPDNRRDLFRFAVLSVLLSGFLSPVII